MEETFASVESWTIRPVKARDFDGVVRARARHLDVLLFSFSSCARECARERRLSD